MRTGRPHKSHSPKDTHTRAKADARQGRCTTHIAEQLLPQQHFARGTPAWVLLQAQLHHLLEVSRKPLSGHGWVGFERRRVLLQGLEHHCDGVVLGVGREALCQLEGRDAHRPHICHRVVPAQLLHHFRRHPARRADECLRQARGGGGMSSTLTCAQVRDTTTLTQQVIAPLPPSGGRPSPSANQTRQSPQCGQILWSPARCYRP